MLGGGSRDHHPLGQMTQCSGRWHHAAQAQPCWGPPHLRGPGGSCAGLGVNFGVSHTQEVCSLPLTC